MELPQVIFLHNRHSKKSRDFLVTVPIDIGKVDCYPIQGYEETSEYWINGQDYIKKNGETGVRTFPSVIIQVPAYHDDIQGKNIESYQHYLEYDSGTQDNPNNPIFLQSFSDWSDIVSFVDFVNQRAIDNPPILY